MANHKKSQGPKTRLRLRDFVTVAFAEDIELAKQYKKMLNESEISAVIKPPPDSSSSFPGIAVMVPEDNLDEAHVLIESQGANDSFYDLAFQEDDQFDDTNDDLDDNLDDSFYEQDV